LSQLRLHQEIAGYQFEGPYINLQRISKEPGIYAIISYDGKQYYLLDIGYSNNIRKACQKNSAKTCWETHNQGKIHFGFFKNDDFNEEAYKIIVEEVRKKYPKIPCS
jgi:hypothetical protein